MDKQERFRQIPKIDKVLKLEKVQPFILKYGYEAVRKSIREAEELLRRQILQEEENTAGEWKETPEQGEDCLEFLCEQLESVLNRGKKQKMQPVVNGTGIILHTNLGRAPLGEQLVQELVPLMTSYTNLELDLETGKRGSRYDHFSESLCDLTGAEAAIAVNNNAAAVLVMLSALASGKETIVSRGELVEIGGKFRIPDVCVQSGTVLVEVGTTNRTYREDFETAVTENAAAILKVHTSNYQITGFTHEVSVRELAETAHQRGVWLLVDLGSGCLRGLETYGYPAEKQVQNILKDGADVVCFSADKLLGGPQAGILAGKKELIQKISKHPLMRAVRIDKFTAAALEKTLDLYLENRENFEENIPIYEMIGKTRDMLENQANRILESCGESKNLQVEKVATRNYIGGGTTPGKSLPGVALRVKSKKMSAEEIGVQLREWKKPILGRMEKEWVYLEMRTLLNDDEKVLAEALNALEKK